MYERLTIDHHDGSQTVYYRSDNGKWQLEPTTTGWLLTESVPDSTSAAFYRARLAYIDQNEQPPAHLPRYVQQMVTEAQQGRAAA